MDEAGPCDIELGSGTEFLKSLTCSWLFSSIELSLASDLGSDAEIYTWQRSCESPPLCKDACYQIQRKQVKVFTPEHQKYGGKYLHSPASCERTETLL